MDRVRRSCTGIIIIGHALQSGLRAAVLSTLAKLSTHTQGTFIIDFINNAIPTLNIIWVSCIWILLIYSCMGIFPRLVTVVFPGTS